MVRLSVNLNKIATVRNARGGDNPNVLQAARTCIEAGCHGITVHPRPDERHIRRQDVLELADMLTVELNIEGYPSAQFVELVERVRPAQATLVPDPPEVLTSNAGWDLGGDVDWLPETIQRLQACGARVSLFLEPDVEQVERAGEIRADRIELYTERYAATHGTPDGEGVYSHYQSAAEKACEIGLGLNAGHDLDLRNLSFFAQNTPGLLEVSIGHALICDALYMGLSSAVRAYLKALGYGLDSP
jgi:pyridoxine 5-phosphate synthase